MIFNQLIHNDESSLQEVSLHVAKSDSIATRESTSFLCYDIRQPSKAVHPSYAFVIVDMVSTVKAES
jgi:hypothetical protein